ncbi:uncharacterized protein LOC114026067 [Vombatus ursinus]|uniref:uncharacterized protein LOC114026067 n=1 Tax=Vombatus ursinus TaxID=29139 RepID=UPI000FFD78F9|nr:uncharacterized protein LOC114026067 [Vombatus ursinus]
MTLTALQRKPSGLSQLVLPGPECLGQADTVGDTGVATDDVFPPSKGSGTMPFLVLKTYLPILNVHHDATPGINETEKCSGWKGTQTGRMEGRATEGARSQILPNRYFLSDCPAAVLHKRPMP